MADVSQNQTRISIFSDDVVPVDLAPTSGSSNTKALSIQGVTGGAPITAAAGSANIVADTNNSTTSVLAAGATFTGTATNVLAYAQIIVKIYSLPSTAKASLYIEFSDEGTNWDTSIPYLVRTGTLFIPQPLINVGKFFRLRYINDGGVAAIASLGLSDTAGTPTLQTAFRLTSYLHPNATKELTRTIDQGISGSDPASLVISTGLGRQPDGDLVKEKADGTAFTTTTALGVGAVYESAWFDTDGWRSVELFIATNVASNADGIQIQFTDDVSAGTPTVRGTILRTFGTAEVTNGFAVYRFPVAIDGFRIRYTNGGTIQASFFLQANLRVTAVEVPQASIETTLSATNNAVTYRGIMAAKSAAGAYANIERGTNGGLDVGIVQHEVDTPIKALTTGQISQTSVLTSATRLDTSALSGRKCVSVKLLNSAGRKVYLGYSSGVTTGNGYELDAGQAHEMDLSTDKEIWAIADTSAQTVCVNQIG